MNLKTLSNGQALLLVDPLDCEIISHACDQAVDQIVGADEGPIGQALETMGAAFKAIGIACVAQWNMNAADLGKLDAELRRLHLIT